METGYQLQQWVFVERLGEGGMAEVWKARHVHLDQFAAIKFLLPQYALNPEVQERFLREGRSQFQLRHPNIIKSTDFITQDDRDFLVMDYVAGGSLEDLVLDGALPVERALELALPLLDALGYAQENGIVHRDVKPSNVLLDESGKPYLTDFGIAKAIQPSGSGSARSMTGTSLMMGSAHYMSPEQIQKPSEVDARSDIYSFGCMLYEMLTGRPPFDCGGAGSETNFEIMTQHVSEEPQPLRELNPAVPARIEAVVLRALAKEKSDRFDSCKAMASSLQEPKVRRHGTVVDHGVANDADSGVDKKKKRTGTTLDTDRGQKEIPLRPPEPGVRKPWFQAFAMVLVGVLLAAAVYLAIPNEHEPQQIVVDPVENPPAIPPDNAPAVDPPPSSSSDAPTVTTVTPPVPNEPQRSVNPAVNQADEAKLAQLRQLLHQIRADEGAAQSQRQALQDELRNQQRNASQLADQLRAAQAGFRNIEDAAVRLQSDLEAAAQSGQRGPIERQITVTGNSLRNLRSEEARWIVQLRSLEQASRDQESGASQLAQKVSDAESEQRRRGAEATRLVGLFSGMGAASDQAMSEHLARQCNEQADSLRNLYLEALQSKQRPRELDLALGQRQSAAKQLEETDKALRELPPGGPTPPVRGVFSWQLNLREGQTALIRFKPDGQIEYIDGTFLQGEGLHGVRADLRISSSNFEVTQPLMPSTGYRQIELKCKKRHCGEVVQVTWTSN